MEIPTTYGAIITTSPARAFRWSSFVTAEHEDYHQVTDHADKIDFPKMEQIARLAFWTGWKTVNAAKRPRDLGKQSKWIK